MSLISWFKGEAKKVEPQVKYERRPLDKIEDMALMGASDSEVIEAAENFISFALTTGEAKRLQNAIKPYGGIILGGAPIIVWVDPKTIRHISYSSDLM